MESYWLIRSKMVLLDASQTLLSMELFNIFQVFLKWKRLAELHRAVVLKLISVPTMSVIHRLAAFRCGMVTIVDAKMRFTLTAIVPQASSTF